MNTDDIVHYCLNEIAAGRLTPRAAALRFPEVEQLEEILQAAARLETLPPPALNPAVSQALEARLRAQARPQPAVAVRRSAAWRRVAALAMLLLLVLVSTGVARAAGDSLPGQWLYPVKRAAEFVRTNLTPARQQAKLHAEFARERANEVLALVEGGAAEPHLIQAIAAELTSETEAALAQVSQAPVDRQAEVLTEIIAVLAHQQAVLETVVDQVPAQAQASVTQALENAHTQQAQALAHLQAVIDHSNPPPGQTNVPPGQTQVPPGQTQVPPGQTQVPPGQTRVPPGQAQKTPTPTAPSATQVNTELVAEASPTSAPTQTPPPTQANNGGGNSTLVPNCHAGSPNSPNYCTPTAAPSEAAPVSETAEPTACPTNPGGQPKCNK